MMICSKCNRKCDAVSESRNTDYIYSDSIAVSSCCRAGILNVEEWDAITNYQVPTKVLYEDSVCIAQGQGIEPFLAPTLTEQWENTVSTIIGMRIARGLEDIASSSK